MSGNHHQPITRQNNTISVSGPLRAESYRYALAATHQAISDRGYTEIILDFSQCTAAFPVAMLPICAQAMECRADGVDFSLVLPEREDLRKLFINANWANLIDAEHAQSPYKGYMQVPATVFRDPSEQYGLAACRA